MNTTDTTTYTTRPATYEDIPAIVDMYNAVLIDAWGKPDWDVESAESEMRDPDFDINEQLCMWFDADNTFVGYGAVVKWGNPPVRPNVNAFVHPVHPNRLDLSLEIMAWGEEVAKRISIPFCPPDAKVSMVSFNITGYTFIENLLQTYGMERARQFWTMEIDLSDAMPEPVMPEGFSIRTIRYPEEARDVYFFTDEAFRDHYGNVPDPEGKNLESWQHHKFNTPHFDPSLWFVVESNGEVAGFAWCHLGMPDDAQLGWVDTLGTLPAFRKKGVGLALLHHAFREFYQRGMARAGLGVDASSLTGATHLYERAGMRAVAGWEHYTKVLRDGVDLIRQ